MVLPILRSFPCAEDRLGPAGHDGADSSGIRAERGGALRGLEDAQAAAGSRSEEDEIPSGSENVRCEARGPGNGAPFSGCGEEGPSILVQQQRHHSLGGQGVETPTAGVAALCQESGPAA